MTPAIDPPSDSPMPDPQVWPQCSECHRAYVMRRGYSFGKGWMWVWQQDCKHGRKGSPQPDAIIARADA